MVPPESRPPAARRFLSVSYTHLDVYKRQMLSTAILFIFSISYFTMMSDAGLFDPIINFLIKRAGKNVATIFIAIVLTTFVAHLDGSGATTFLIVVPAFLPICKRMGVRPQALLAAMCGAYGVMTVSYTHLGYPGCEAD